MKKHKTTALVPARKAKAEVVEPEIVDGKNDEPTALTVAFRLPKIKGKTPGERINSLHKLSVASGKLSIAAGILAGWELSCAHAACDHGQWLAWLAKNTEISPNTARNYMSVYAATLGAARAARPKPVPLETQPTTEDVAAASANVEAKSLSALYAQLRLLKRSDNHGGDRRAAAEANGNHIGRPSKAKESVAEQLDAALASETLKWSETLTHLEALVDCFPTPESVARLSDERLGRLFAALFPILDEARKQMVARAKGNGNGKRLAEIFAEEK